MFISDDNGCDPTRGFEFQPRGCVRVPLQGRQEPSAIGEEIQSGERLILQKGVQALGVIGQRPSDNICDRRQGLFPGNGSSYNLYTATSVARSGNRLELSAAVGPEPSVVFKRAAISVKHSSAPGPLIDWSKDAAAWSNQFKAFEEAVRDKILRAFEDSRFEYGRQFVKLCCTEEEAIKTISSGGCSVFHNYAEDWIASSIVRTNRPSASPRLGETRRSFLRGVIDLARGIDQFGQNLRRSYEVYVYSGLQILAAIQFSAVDNQYSFGEDETPSPELMEAANRRIEYLRGLQLEAEDIQRRCQALNSGLNAVSQAQRLVTAECLNHLVVACGWASDLDCRESLIKFKESILKDHPELDLRPSIVGEPSGDSVGTPETIVPEGLVQDLRELRLSKEETNQEKGQVKQGEQGNPAGQSCTQPPRDRVSTVEARGCQHQCSGHDSLSAQSRGSQEVSEPCCRPQTSYRPEPAPRNTGARPRVPRCESRVGRPENSVGATRNNYATNDQGRSREKTEQQGELVDWSVVRSSNEPTSYRDPRPRVCAGIPAGYEYSQTGYGTDFEEQHSAQNRNSHFRYEREGRRRKRRRSRKTRACNIHRNSSSNVPRPTNEGRCSQPGCQHGQEGGHSHCRSMPALSDTSERWD